MKKTSKQNKENSNNFKVELACWKVDEKTDDGGEELGARPEGGFQNLMYLCDINGQKPLHYHYAWYKFSIYKLFQMFLPLMKDSVTDETK